MDQPWYEPPKAPPPGADGAGDNPYARSAGPWGGPSWQPQDPPPLASACPSRRRTAVLAGAAALALVLLGAGLYAGLGGGSGKRGGGADRTAGPTVAARPPAGPQAPSPSSGGAAPGLGADINIGRAAGEARAWAFANDLDVPDNTHLYDLWFAGDTVVQAAYTEVTALRTADGTKAWGLRLPAPVCDTPVGTTPDGKVVVAYSNGGGTAGGPGRRCDHLMMIDLKTGKPGWTRKLTSEDSSDSLLTVHLAISGDTLMVGRFMSADAYRVSDGAPLFVSRKENPGGCYPDDVAGGVRLLQVDHCGITGKTPQDQIKELDPRTGKVKWRFRLPTGQKLWKVLSVDPVVVVAQDRTDIGKWTAVVLDSAGRRRTVIDPGDRGLDPCDEGDSGEGVQNCRGPLVGGGMLYASTEGRLGAFSLATGKFAWGRKVEAYRPFLPLKAEGGTLVAYVGATSQQPGRTLRLGPGPTKVTVLMRHTSSARAPEQEMLGGNVAYAAGRVFVTDSLMDGDDRQQVIRMLSFGD
ncbi:PQQ-binding-like beta-propeller repeat protein [Streptomyces sp. NPDC101132]|uniref:outer membrane protein assembly factor BamB family protein n=1 Tax=Streptomyces sp. NPDC101132 TaxID=3366110 RepID=UPI00381A425B